MKNSLTEQTYSRDRYLKYKTEFRARGKVNSMIMNGNLTRRPCEVCGDENTQAHHCDYNKPLDVMWLCMKHHKEWHRDNEPIRAVREERVIRCFWCNKEFVPKERHTLYCSPECKLEGRRSANRRSAHNNGYKYTKTYKNIQSQTFSVCPVCHNEFINPRKKYCSHECFLINRRKSKRDAYHARKCIDISH